VSGHAEQQYSHVSPGENGVPMTSFSETQASTFGSLFN
jgi:hypothetical protein